MHHFEFDTSSPSGHMQTEITIHGDCVARNVLGTGVRDGRLHGEIPTTTVKDVSDLNTYTSTRNTDTRNCLWTQNSRRH